MFASENLRVIDYAPHEAMAPHSHDDGSFGVIVGGDFVEHVGKSERRYAGGCVTYAPAGVTHSQRFGRQGARQIIVTPQEDWLSYLGDCRVRLSESPFVHAPHFHQLGHRLLDELRRDDAFAAVAREGIVLEIIAAFGRAATVHPAGNVPAWLGAARDYLHAHAGVSLSMKEIARAAGRHEIHLAREFRRYFGLSVGSYLRQVRTERAAHLLRHSRSDITDIALRCGFASHAHLCRVFKAHYGVTPSQYRARH
ncbi:MAG TPA: AraC family transcriptional regulator [Rhizomicrobium sp.]|nr:AraC family transcriptional regulator [Rhizomicrobium sp.]